MRVVHVSKVVGIAGSEGHLLNLLPGLAHHNIDPYMIILADPRIPVEAFCDALAACGIAYEVQPLRGHIDLTLTNRLKERFADLKPDLVHTHLIHADLYGLPAARQAGEWACSDGQCQPQVWEPVSRATREPGTRLPP